LRAHWSTSGPPPFAPVVGWSSLCLLQTAVKRQALSLHVPSSSGAGKRFYFVIIIIVVIIIIIIVIVIIIIIIICFCFFFLDYLLLL